MPNFIKSINVTHLNGSFHLINADTHTGTGEFFRTDKAAVEFLQGEGFTWDPATDEYTRS